MLTTILIGAAIGAGLAVAVILGAFELRTKEMCKEQEVATRTFIMRIFTLTAENAQLRVSLAAGDMPEDQKKVAAMTIAALSTVIPSESETLLKRRASPVPSQEPARSLEDKR
jgi:hypothetical protein